MVVLFQHDPIILEYVSDVFSCSDIGLPQGFPEDGKNSDWVVGQKAEVWNIEYLSKLPVKW